MFKLSCYNTLWKTENASYLVFNSLSGAFYKLTQEMYDALISENFSILTEAIIDQFLDAYILIPSDVESREIFEFEMLNVRTQKERIGIFLVPSQSCNLACPYCVQNNLFDKVSSPTLSKGLIDSYFNWLSKNIKRWQTKKLDFIFYGGEPLTAEIDVLEYLIHKFDSLPIKPDYKLITNGTRLYEYSSVLRFMKTVQITIDGNRFVHDQRRISKGGQGTFDTIMNNIHWFLNESGSNRVVIRMNVDKENRANLLDDVKEICSLLPMNQVDVSLNPVDVYLRGMTDEMIHGDIRETAKAIVHTYEYLNETYNIVPHIWRVNCGVSSICQWTFDADGSIYKCPSLTGEPARAVCNVKNGRLKGSFYRELAYVTSDEECLACAHLGLCYGGCIRQEELLGKKSCKKNFFDSCVPPLLEIKYGIKNHHSGYKEVSNE